MTDINYLLIKNNKNHVFCGMNAKKKPYIVHCVIQYDIIS